MVADVQLGPGTGFHRRVMHSKCAIMLYGRCCPCSACTAQQCRLTPGNRHSRAASAALTATATVARDGVHDRVRARPASARVILVMIPRHGRAREGGHAHDVRLTFTFAGSTSAARSCPTNRCRRRIIAAVSRIRQLRCCSCHCHAELIAEYACRAASRRNEL